MIEEILNVVNATDHSIGTTGSTSIRNNDEHNAAAPSLTCYSNMQHHPKYEQYRLLCISKHTSEGLFD
jgi:hypothetical protein